MTTLINIPLGTTLFVQSPSLLENYNIPPLTIDVAKRGKRSPSPIGTSLFPEFDKFIDLSLEVASTSSTDSERDQSKMTKSERKLVNVFSPLKFSNDPKPLPGKFNQWFPKFKGIATWTANCFIEE